MAHIFRTGKKDAPSIASGRFRGFGPETERDARTIKVEMNPALEELKRVWAECRFGYSASYDKDYLAITEKIKQLRYSPIDIEGFSILLAGFQGEEFFPIKAGLYLSALVNNCQEDGFIIHTNHLATLVSAIGFRNRKSIIVHGDVDSIAGEDMECGTMTINGNAGDNLGGGMKDGAITVHGDADGWIGNGMRSGTITIKGDSGRRTGWTMRGGEIIVEGDAGDEVGALMSGGIIRVDGTAGSMIGDRMDGGEIHLKGRYFNISSDFNGGKIFHEGKLLYEKRCL